MSATCSRDTNCDSDQAGPGNSGAHANGAGGGRLPANPVPGVVRGAGLSERSSRTACLLKASARGCLHHRQVQFWGQLEASLVPFLHLIPAGMLQRQQQRNKNTHHWEMYVPGYHTAVTKANAAFPRGYSSETSSTDSVLQNRSVPHVPSFCSQPSSSHCSAPCPARGFDGM